MLHSFVRTGFRVNGPVAILYPPLPAARTMELFKAYRRGGVDSVVKLLDRGVPVNAVDDDKWTALMLASYDGYDAVVRLLLERGAAIDHTDYDGWTALMCATYAGRVTAAQVLIEHGASIGMVGEIAKENRLHGMVRLILSYGSEPTEHEGVPVPLVRDCRRAVEESVIRTGDRDVARLCGDFVSMVDRW